MYLPDLDMDNPEQKQQALAISLHLQEQHRRMIEEDLVRANFRSRLVHELCFDSHKMLQQTWIDALSLQDNWFEQHRQNLLQRFNGQYVAVTNFLVVDDDKDLGAITRRVRDKYGAAAVLIKRVVPYSEDSADRFMSGLR